MSITLKLLSVPVLPRRGCSLCSGTGWQSNASPLQTCPRCRGNGTPQRNASERVLDALRGVVTVDQARQSLLELSLELPETSLDAYRCGIHDGETAAVAAIWVWLETWLPGEARKAA